MLELNLNQELSSRLCCPKCHENLMLKGSSLCCENPACSQVYPVVRGIPVLINEQKSIFRFSDYQQDDRTRVEPGVDKLAKYLPTLNKNLASEANYKKLGALLKKRSSRPRVLVIGGKILGSGIQFLYEIPQLDIVEMDVDPSLYVKIIADAHDIPFLAETFDGVVVQAVLEHVCDPYRCVDEIHRVLLPKGIVYAETPFMQQVHEGPYDFTRFTHLGHRRLFRKYKEIESGIACGPGMALAWAYRYFLLSFATGKMMRDILSVFSRFTGFMWKYWDNFLVKKAGAYDCASGFFFFGEKSDEVLSDRDLIAQYRGAIRRSGYLSSGMDH